MITKNYPDILPLLDVIISHVNDAVIIFDEERTIHAINPAALKLLDIAPQSKIKDFSDLNALNTGINLSDYITESFKNKTDVSSPDTSDMITHTEIRLFSKDRYKDLEIQCCAHCDLKDKPDLSLLFIKDITQQKRLETYLKTAADDLITNDPNMLQLLAKINRIAPSTANILLQGQSGTGKTHLAKLIHKMSRRADQPLITLNCAAIPEQLIESELFGQVEGVFNSKSPMRQGRFKYADRGTLLLDEIGEIPLHLQAKLLRAIQDHEFEPVGSDETVKVDVRIIASSNQNLLQMVNNGSFRADLYYRLAVIPLFLPTLKQRPGDIPLLIRHFCNQLISRGYNHQFMECGAETMRAMMNYPWPGNVRELENAVEHAIICSDSKIIRPESLPLEIVNYTQKQDVETSDQAQQGHKELLRHEIILALESAQGNKTVAARHLGVNRSTLWRRMKKLQIKD